MKKVVAEDVEIDTEWVSLIKEALAIGITEKEIRDFLKKPL